MIKENENLISIDEFIARAKNFGVDFGKGDPRNRLRYYTKIGLLPHAQRKSFNGLPPNGAYSKSVLGILLDIDKKLKAGKSIQEIKREREEKKLITEIPPIHIYKPLYEPFSEVEEPVEEPIPEIPKKEISYFPLFKKIAFLVLMIFFLASIVFSANKFLGPNFFSPFLASLVQLVQKPFAQIPEIPETIPEKEKISSLLLEPYLTINAQTVINALLNVKEKITSPTFALLKDKFEGRITIANLTDEREYIFPDLSGTVCLTTGNCIGLGGEVMTPGGTSNRLAKFIANRRIGDSSISDLYIGGVAITVDSFGRVGVGTATPKAKLEVAGDFLTPNLFVSGATDGKVGIKMTEPKYDLHVKGRIQATGDICTDIGGKCLSQVSTGAIFFGGGGISGSGSSGYLPIWTDTTALGNSIVSQSGTTLNVAGTLKMTGFQLTTGATSGYILTSDGSGVGTWQSPATGTIPIGTTGQTLRHDGTNWLANSFLYNTGSAIGIGTTSTLATLTVAGNGYFTGPLTIATSTIAQLALQYDSNNYLNFEISTTTAKILSSKKLVFNSLTGEIQTGDNVTLFNASNATMTAFTFISNANDATVRKSGEKVFRANVPIFKFPISSQTASTSYVAVTKQISTSTLNAALPESLPGTTRKFSLLINFADDISTNASSTWLIDLTTGTDIEFTFSGQNLSSLSEGVPHMSQIFDPPSVNWQLKVKVPLITNNIRIFNTFLLVFDQVN